MVKIYVDADACPVKNEVERIATRHNLETYLVCDGGIRPPLNPLIQLVVVNQGADAADDWIAEEVKEGDIVVTQDIPLAARCVEKGALVLGNSGREHTPETIGMAVAMRDLKQHLRETGEDRGYNRAFSREDRSVFLQALDRICRRSKRP